jgi:hypothetical protein
VPAAPSLAAVAPATRPGPVLLITREQLEKLDANWRALNKTDADRAKAFAWLGCDSIDLTWDELTAEQADRLIAKLLEQMARVGNGGAK